MEFEENKTLAAEEVKTDAQPEIEATADPMDAIAKETIEEVEKTETPFDDMIKEEQRKAAAPKDRYAPAFKPIVINGAVFKPLANPGPQPVVAPTAHVQLTPIIVPVAIVPFASQNQPVMQYEEPKKAAAPEKVEEPQEEVVVQDEEQNVEPEVSDAYAEETYAEPAVPEYYAPAVETAPAVVVSDGKAKETAPSGKKQKYRGRNAIMTVMLLVFLIPAILGCLIGQGVLKGEQELFAGIKISDLATERDVIGEVIGFVQNGKLVEGLQGDIGLCIHLALLVIVAICMIVSLIGIFTGCKLKTGTMGCIIFIVSLVLLLWVALLKAMLVDGNKFSIDLITSNLDNLIGYARIWIAAIVTWIVGAVIRVRKPKNKSGKKEKKAKA
ncbi:MAG: hypothetical protein SOX15_02445 [Eubacteriales bacterium]|nr:hypothetical protein [Eubacteriales bacterium]